MDIMAQCCSLIIILVLLYFVSRRKYNKLYAERFFRNFLIIDLVCVLLSIAAVIMTQYVRYISVIVVDLFNKLYIISTLVMVYYSLLYTFVNCRGDREYKKHSFQVYFCIQIIAIAILSTPLKYMEKGNSVFCIGLAYFLGFIGQLFLILMIFYYVNKYKSTISLKRYKTIKIWASIWTSAILLQMMFPYVAIESFALTLGGIIIFFELENPESRLDRETGLYDTNTLYSYLDYKMNRGHSYSLLITTINTKDIEYSKTELNKMMQYIAFILINIKDVISFRNLGNEFVSIIDDDIEFSHNIIRNQIMTMINACNISSDLLPSYSIITDTDYFRNSSELLKFISDYKDSDAFLTTPDSFVLLGIRDFEQFRASELISRNIIDAINDDRIEIYFQPIYSTSDNRFVSAEVLIRMIGKDGSITPPDSFIPVAEKTDLILDIDRIAFEKACQFIRSSVFSELGLDYLELNLSVRNGESKQLVSEYKEIIENYGIDPKTLNLEITETSTVEKKKRLLENMKEFTEYGLHFSLDDFGSGESNLNYIIDMPVSIVKFDKDMTQSYFNNKKAKIVMTSIIDLIHDLDLKVVIEGVETKEQLIEMTRIGSDFIQGYYFSKPIPMSDFITFLREFKNLDNTI